MFVKTSGVPISGTVRSSPIVGRAPRHVDGNGELADQREPTDGEPGDERGQDEHVRDDGPDGRADDAQFEAEDQHRVNGHVDHRTARSKHHRRPRVVGTDERPTADEIQPRERNPDRDDPEVVRTVGDRRGSLPTSAINRSGTVPYSAASGSSNVRTMTPLVVTASVTPFAVPRCSAGRPGRSSHRRFRHRSRTRSPSRESRVRRPRSPPVRGRFRPSQCPPRTSTSGDPRDDPRPGEIGRPLDASGIDDPEPCEQAADRQQEPPEGVRDGTPSERHGRRSVIRR